MEVCSLVGYLGIEMYYWSDVRGSHVQAMVGVHHEDEGNFTEHGGGYLHW